MVVVVVVVVAIVFFNPALGCDVLEDVVLVVVVVVLGGFAKAILANEGDRTSVSAAVAITNANKVVFICGILNNLREMYYKIFHGYF